MASKKKADRRSYAKERNSGADGAESEANRPSRSRGRRLLSLGYTGTGGADNGIPVYRYRYIGLPVTQILDSPFSAVSKLIFATKG